eukprot:769896-Pleurochrysis_carterae.AAC.3
MSTRGCMPSSRDLRASLYAPRRFSWRVCQVDGSRPPASTSPRQSLAESQLNSLTSPLRVR